jgi:hypothetical protein
MAVLAGTNCFSQLILYISGQLRSWAWMWGDARGEERGSKW